MNGSLGPCDSREVDDYGAWLLAALKSPGVHISNGRTFVDLGSAYTCFHYNVTPSVIDYFFETAQILSVSW